MAKIDQQAHYDNNFGYVFRASGIFYFRSSPEFETTISFLNYWKLRRDIKVSVLVSLRDMAGKLIKRELADFKSASVYNFTNGHSKEDFEGSVEVEVFSNENLTIPYAAIMGVYKTPHSIAQVHSYARCYSSQEVEEGRTISDGEESCWTIRDSKDVTSFGVAHNGNEMQPAQTITLSVQNWKGEKLTKTFDLHELKPYESFAVTPKKHFPNLIEFLNDRPGNASISFKLKNAFTRMLLVNESKTDFQATHSNFNYSIHETNHLSQEANKAWMYLPNLSDRKMEVVVYPDSDKGEYATKYLNETISFKSGDLVTIPLLSQEPIHRLEFSALRALPSRIVTGVRFENGPGRIPAECSLGVNHVQRPKKRMWWGLCAGSSLKTRLSIIPLVDIAGEPEENGQMTIAIWSSKGTESLQKTITYNRKECGSGLYLHKFFPEMDAFLGDEMGWFTFYSDFPGFLLYGILENQSGVLGVEHAF